MTSLDNKARIPLGAYLLFALFCAGALALTYHSGPRHDYGGYLFHWFYYMNGENPWNLSRPELAPNTYGPLYLLFAHVAQINPAGPKLIFTLCWLASTGWLLWESYRAGVKERWLRWALWGIFCFNPFLWIDIALYGHFDICVALLCGLAVSATVKGRYPLAGVLLGLSSLLKFFPGVVLPFLVFPRPWAKKWMVLSFFFTMLVGMGAAWHVYGDAVFTPFMSGAARPSKLLSIFRFLRGAFSPLQSLAPGGNVDFLSMWAIALGLAGLGGLHLWRALETRAAALMCILLTLTLYKVGHPQLQTVTLVLTGQWLLAQQGRPLDRPTLRAMWGFVGFLAFYSVFYQSAGMLRRRPWILAREVLGLPSFLVNIAFLLSLLKRERTPASGEIEEHAAEGPVIREQP